MYRLIGQSRCLVLRKTKKKLFDLKERHSNAFVQELIFKLPSMSISKTSIPHDLKEKLIRRWRRFVFCLFGQACPDRHCVHSKTHKNVPECCVTQLEVLFECSQVIWLFFLIATASVINFALINISGFVATRCVAGCREAAAPQRQRKAMVLCLAPQPLLVTGSCLSEHP